MFITRRDAFLFLPLISSLASASETLKALPSSAQTFESLPVEREEHVVYRSILEGKTHTRDYLEAHHTVLDPDSSPHPKHRHEAEELYLVSSGTLEITISGKVSRLGAGGAAFVASNEEHRI